MNILIINQFGRSKVLSSDFVPSIGDKIDVFYEPLPEVTMVLAYPSDKRLEALGVDRTDIDVIVTVS